MKEPNLSVEKYDRLEHNNLEHRNYVVINWCLGNVCNYRCSYCPDNLHNGSHPWPNQDVVIAFIDKVMTHYKGRKLYFEFTGGEVTLWKDLMSVASYLRSKDCRIGIISNGSRSMEYYQKLAPFIDHICLSFHPESAKEDHFHSVVSYFADKLRTHVNFMMEPSRFNQVLAFSMKIKNIANISIALQPLMEGLAGDVFPYSELQTQAMNKQHELVIKHIQYTKNFEYYRGAMAMVNSKGERKTMAPQRFISSGNNNWKGWSCHAGLEQIVVDMDGGVFRGWCKAGGAIGQISDQNLNLPTAPIRCPKTQCHCNLDIMATKEKVASQNENTKFFNFWNKLVKGTYDSKTAPQK